MKKIILSIYVLMTCLAFQACKKDSPGTFFPPDNSLPPYVQFTSKTAKTVKKGGSVSVAFSMRSGLQQDVTITYTVSGVVTLTQTAVIKANTLTTTATTAPAFVVPATTTPGAATITLVSATETDGTKLTIGQDNVPANQVISLTITN